MVNYVLRRLLLMPITLVGITIMVFLIARFAPGSPAMMQGADAAIDAETQKAMIEWYEERYGLNLPLWQQYGRWLRGLVTKKIQATAWTDDPQARRVFTLRRTEPEYYLRVNDDAWMQVVRPRFRDESFEVDDPEFRAMLRVGDLEHHPAAQPGYATPTHLLVEGELVEIESLAGDLKAGRLERAEDLTRVDITIDAPAWSASGDPLYINPGEPHRPLFEREGAWFELPIDGLDVAEVKPINDAAVASRMGWRYRDLPPALDGYALPRHAFFFGIPRRIDPPADPDALERLTIPAPARSPSGIWVQLPDSEAWGMLWQAAKPEPMLLVQDDEGAWKRLVGETRVQPPKAVDYRQSDERLQQRLGPEARLAHPPQRIDPQTRREPRHTLYSGQLVDSILQPVERDVRRHFHSTWVWELTLGESSRTRTTVMEELKRRLPVTLLLNLIAFPLIYAIAIPTGMLMAVKRGRRFDASANILLLGFWSVPTVLSATLLLGYMARGGAGLEWFPNNGLSSAGMESAAFIGYFDAEGNWVSGWLVDRIWHLVLPILCITYGGLAYLAKQMRASMLDNFTMDYVRTAKAKGVRFKDIVFRHVLRNSLLPLITIFATILPALIAGSIIIEKIFNINGMGLMAFEAVQSRDYDVVQSLALIAGALNLTGLLIADLCYALADPRITYS